MDTVITHFNFNPKQHHGKCKCALTFIPLLSTSNLFTLEVVQKCQHCQLCELWENSTVTLYNNVNLDNIALFKSTLHDSVTEIHINIASFVPIDHIAQVFSKGLQKKFLLSPKRFVYFVLQLYPEMTILAFIADLNPKW